MFLIFIENENITLEDISISRKGDDNRGAFKRDFVAH
jgi:hypothetical protein